MEISSNLIDINSLQVEILSVLKKVNKKYLFLDLNEKFINDYVSKKIKTTKNISDKDSFIKYVKKCFVDYLMQKTKQCLDDDNKFELIVENYVNDYCSIPKNVSSSIDLINQLSLFFSSFNFELTPEKISLLINSNSRILSAIKMIVDKYSKYYINVIENETAISFIEVYCMINNIIFDEEIDIYDDIYDESEHEINNDDIYCEDFVRELVAKARQYPLLTLNEEKELLLRVSNGDDSAKTILFERNQRLVIKIASKYVNRGLDFLDLFQEGSIGLMKAIERFNPSFGSKLSTYSVWWIKQSIQRAIYDLGRNIRLPVYKQEDIQRMIFVENELTVELNREPTLEEIAQKMKLSVKKIIQLKKYMQDAISYNAKVDEDEESELEIFLADSGISLFDDLQKSNTSQILKDILDKYLTERQKEIIILRFGLNGDDKKTLEEVGQIYGLTRERIRQIENKAITTLRKPHVIKQLSEYMSNPDETLKKFVQPKEESVYDYFCGYSKSQIESVLLELSENDKLLLYQKFSQDILSWTNYHENKFKQLVSIIKDTLFTRYGLKKNGDINQEIKTKNKTIYSYFQDYTIEQVDLAISYLSDKDKMILEYRYHLGIIELKEDFKIETRYLHGQLWSIKTKIKNILLGKTLRTKNKTLKNEEKTIYDFFEEYEKDCVDNAIAKLSEVDKILLEYKYHLGVIEIVEEPKLKAKALSQKLWFIKSKIRNILEGKDINDSRVYKIKGFYEYFDGYSKENVDLAVLKLSDKQKELLYLRFGTDLSSTIKNPNWDYHKSSKIYAIIKRIINILEGRSKNKTQKNKVPKKVEIIYDKFPGYTKEEVDNAISLLTDKEKEIIVLRFGEDLENPKTSSEWNYKKHSSRLTYIKKKIKTMMDDKRLEDERNYYKKLSDKPKNQTIYEHFGEYSVEEIDVVIKNLSYFEKEMLKSREGQDLKRAALLSDKFFALLNKMKRKLEFNRNNSAVSDITSIKYNNILFEKLLNSLSQKDCKILEMRFGLYGKSHSILEIAESLNVNEIEVINSLKFSLLKYKEIINFYIQNVIEANTEQKLMLIKESVEN